MGMLTKPLFDHTENESVVDGMFQFALVIHALRYLPLCARAEQCIGTPDFLH